MIYKYVFLLIPLLFLIFFQQLHRVPAYYFSVIYFVLSICYVFAKSEKLPKILRLGQESFKKGSVLTLAFIIIICGFPIGGYMTIPLILPHSTEKADAVVVLASGATLAGDMSYSCYQRVTHGASLVKSGQAKHLYISTGIDDFGFLEYHAVASFTKLLDIPQDKITIFKSEEITTTATEANYIKKEMDKRGINKILLTTSNAHIYRSKLVYEKIGFTVLPAPCHNRKTTVYANNKYSLFRAAMHEWIGLVWYYFRGRL